MELENFVTSLAKVYFKDKKETFQTSWLFSDYGYFLTAGHLFSDRKSNIGDICTLQFEDSEEEFNATLLEYSRDNSNYVDYAVIKIDPNRIETLNKRKIIPIESFNPGKHIGKNFNTIGFAEQINSKKSIPLINRSII